MFWYLFKATVVPETLGRGAQLTPLVDGPKSGSGLGQQLDSLDPRPRHHSDWRQKGVVWSGLVWSGLGWAGRAWAWCWEKFVINILFIRDS